MNWRYVLTTGIALRDAIRREDYGGVINSLMACYDELLSRGLIDEDDYDRYTSDIELLDEDADDIDYELADLYDLCDALHVWVDV